MRQNRSAQQAGDVTLQFGGAHMAERQDSEDRDQAPTSFQTLIF